VVLDGAHNGASAAALADTLAPFLASRPLVLVVGINRDKDAAAVLRPLVERSATVWATRTADNPRARDATELARLATRAGAREVHIAPDLEAALDGARAAARRLGGVVCVTGSLLLVGQARTVLGEPVPERLWAAPS
jgi:dihydrofolate synthase/folylpolyglutamate synthase